MKLLLSISIPYSILSLILFGGLFDPAFWLIGGLDRLGAQFWALLVIVSVALAAAVSVHLMARYELAYRCAAFVAIAMLLSVLSVGVYADGIRRQTIAEFRPDASFQHSFFRSLHEAPKEFQFYLHAGALKDCVPYAWSYRSMNFYRLPDNVAANVIPGAWQKRCGIKIG